MNPQVNEADFSGFNYLKKGDLKKDYLKRDDWVLKIFKNSRTKTYARSFEVKNGSTFYYS